MTDDDDLDGRNDQAVVVDVRLLNCPESADGFHHPHRSRDGQRCIDCRAYIRDSFTRPADTGRPKVVE